MVPQHLSKLESVELGHADIDQHDGDIVLQQELKRFARGIGLDEILA
jgi:hypothetical protein